MAKNIILCSDGTGNSGGKGRGTNVWRLYRALDLNPVPSNPGNNIQYAMHDDGVGTSDFKLFKIIGGALGFGLKRNIRQLYIFLCRIYDPGDQIFIFGFSRGAYTARSLAGLIAQCGIIDAKKHSDKQLISIVNQAINILRQNFRRKVFEQLRGEDWIKEHEQKIKSLAENFRKKYSVHDPELVPDRVPEISFIGVWDTVDAYGFPWDGLADFWHYCIYPFKFPDRQLSGKIQKACHAISIDDERHTFHPVLWEENGADKNRINQVWFAGVHSNIGGGYPKQGMAYVTLDWMMTQVEHPINEKHQGLYFIKHKREDIRLSANVFDKQYDSRAGLAIYYRYKPRDIEVICRQNNIEIPKIHVSALYRAAQHVDNYAPGNLPARIKVVSTEHQPGTPDIPTTTLQMLENAFEKASNGKKLLDRVTKEATIRRFLHHILIVYSLILIGFGCRSSEFCPAVDQADHWVENIKGIFTFIPLVGGWFFGNIVKPIFVCPQFGILIVGILLVVWWLWYTTKTRMKKIFKEFWDKIFADMGLRKI